MFTESELLHQQYLRDLADKASAIRVYELAVYRLIESGHTRSDAQAIVDARGGE